MLQARLAAEIEKLAMGGLANIENGTKAPLECFEGESDAFQVRSVFEVGVYSTHALAISCLEGLASNPLSTSC